MSIGGALQLAWRYVSRHRVQSLLLAGALGVVLALPPAVRVIVDTMQQQLRTRAQSTPLVAGPVGSATDLMLAALHFRHTGDATLPVKACDTIRDTNLAEAIPLYVRFHAQEAPIVGTELDYFDFRKLRIAQGRMLTRLGDCVVGAKVAAARGLHPGDAVFSSPEQVFDIAGVYPLKMRVTGIFAPTGTPDDESVFVDLKTTWLIQGIAHGHDDVTNAADILKKEGDNVIANKAVRIYSEVTDANIGSFHFHGDEDAFPISAIVVLPHDAKSEAIMSGRYQASKEVQMLRPVEVMEGLVQTLFRVERVVVAALALVAGAALLVALLVFGLSFRLRRAEFATLEDIGVSANTLRLAKIAEVCIVGFGALVLGALVLLLASRLAEVLVMKGVLG